MGVVWLARHEATGQLVALKMPSAPDDPEARASFLREAQHEGMMQHPNIVTMYQYFEHEGQPWIAMEYFELDSVRLLIGRLSDQQCALVLTDVLRGLEHAHHRQVVHRDLKPENLMRSTAGPIKIADFGIARSVDGPLSNRLTDPAMFKGAIPYVAPEVVAGEDAEPSADLYAVGVIAFELFARSVPFAELKLEKIPVAKVTTAAPRLHDLRPDLDRGLCRWVDGLLSREPEKRPAGAADARHQLESIAEAVWGTSWLRTQLPVDDLGPAMDPAPVPPPSRFTGERQLDRCSTRKERLTHAFLRRRNLLVVLVAMTVVLTGAVVTDSLRWPWILCGLLVLSAGLVATTYFDEHEAFLAGRAHPRGSHSQK
jgi:serine/threonine protein kinase